MIQKAMSEDSDFQRSLKIVQKNSSGKIWAAGGFIFRNLASAIHNLPKPTFKDYDFVVEKINKELDLEENMGFTLNTFGSIKIKNGPITIDVWEPEDVYLATDPTIENYLKTVSLNIQSIAYSIKNNKVLGDIGLKAVLDKKIMINNPQKLKYYTDKKGITIENYIDQKIKSWGFEDFFFDRNSL
jgi:hypothetical protein